MFTFGISYGVRDATDGTSNTIAFAEKLVGNDGAYFVRDGAPGSTYRGNMLNLTDQPPANTKLVNAFQNRDGIRQAVEACRQRFPTFREGINDYAGWRWSFGQTGFTLLNTIQPPNDTFGGCRYGVESLNWFPDNAFAYGASSAHPGGVNVCLADGSVRFIKSSVNLDTWWSLGTRAGGEIVSADAY